MARPKKMATERLGVVVAIRVTVEQLAWIEAEAKRLGGLDRSAVIRMLIAERMSSTADELGDVRAALDRLLEGRARRRGVVGPAIKSCLSRVSKSPRRVVKRARPSRPSRIPPPPVRRAA